VKIIVEEVLGEKGKHVAVSSESPFYPDGKGGQLGDRGKIGDRNVLRVYEKKGKVFHVLDGALDPGEYEVWIDEERRKEIARQHTAQHILSAALVKVADIETVSFHMGEDFSTIDLNAAPILQEVLDEAEDLANTVILENRRVVEHLVDREEASKFPLRKPISEKVKGKVRIIEVEGFDWSACGGFHAERTGEIGIVKIIDHEKIKGSLTRVYFVAGMRALKDYRKRVKLIWNLSKLLTTSVDEMEARVGNLLEDVKEKAARLDKLAEEYAKTIAESLLESAQECCGVKIVVYDGYEEVGKYVFKFLGDEQNVLIVVKVDKGYEIGSRAVDVGNLIRVLNERLRSKGGGGKNRGRIATDAPVSRIVQEVQNILS